MQVTSGKLARAAWCTLLLCLFAFAGCAAGRETTLSRLSRQREAEAERAGVERLRAEMETLRQEAQETAGRIAAAKSESVRLGAVLRATLAELHHQLDVQKAAEQDLVSSKARALAIEQELAPLRALEKTLADQERLRAEHQQKVAALQAEVAAAEQVSGSKVAELQPRLVLLQRQIAAAQQIEKALADAQAAVAAAAAVLVPPAPAPAPAAGKPPEPPPKK